MSFTCKKLGCTIQLLTPYTCQVCEATFHRACARMSNFLDENSMIIKICGDCQQKPDVLVKYPNKASSRSSSPSNTPTIDHDSESSDDSESECNQLLAKQNLDLKDILGLLIKQGKSSKKSFKKIDQKLDSHSKSATRTEQVQLAQAAEIKELSAKVSFLMANNPSEIIFSGHLSAGGPNAVLVDLVFDIISLLKVPVLKEDIRRVRLVKHKPKPDRQKAPLPVMIATFYSSAHCLRILDNKKLRGKITNADVTPGGDARTEIFINPVLDQASYKFLKECKSKGKSAGFRYIWPADGHVHLRVSETSRVFKVANIDELQQLISTRTQLQRPAVITS